MMPLRQVLMNKTALNILIGGQAGQGLVTIGELLAKSLVRSGYHIVVTQSYESRIRGGHNTFAIRVSGEEIGAPQESVDLLVALNREAAQRHLPELARTGLVLTDKGADFSCDSCVQIPYGELADKRYFNVVALGVAGCLLGLKEDAIGKLIGELFAKKRPDVVDENRKVLAKAFQWASDHQASFRQLSRTGPLQKHLMLNGNEAIALGAFSAGIRFCAFYPMTPSTTIPLSMVATAGEMGVLVEQAEDEIAAINMALGASFAGAPSMVATSGGGFALMAEGVSLAGMTETPLVIVVAQRPGPATGLPTRTEQGDLEFVLHSGHGEFPRAVFAPGSVEQCFHLTRHAAQLAETYQSPIFLLTDQFMADSFRSILPFDIEKLPEVQTGTDSGPAEGAYRRYAFTDTGVSPRLLPGKSRHLVVTGSDEHDEEGHITEDLSIRSRMVEKRLGKGAGLRAAVIPPTFDGEEDAELLLISWGSTKGAAEEAASVLRGQGTRAATLHFPQVWPLIPDLFTGRLHEAKRTVCIEGNANGQFARLIRRETGVEIDKKVLRYDGLPFTAEFILRGLDL
jgi:2-oxoglutarate ferredoxin oxidoreductase subunit alpha